MSPEMLACASADIADGYPQSQAEKYMTQSVSRLSKNSVSGSKEMDMYSTEGVDSDICNDANDAIVIVHRPKTTVLAASMNVDLVMCPECESSSEVIRNGRCTTCTGCGWSSCLR
jgi:hypothetical protein